MKCRPGTPSASSRAQNSVANSIPMERTAAGSSSAVRIRSFRAAGNAALVRDGIRSSDLHAGDRHDLGDDRGVAAGGRDPVTQPQVVLRLEEHLRDRVVRARAALVDEVADVGVPVRGARVHRREGGDAHAEVAGRLDQLDEFGGVGETPGVRHPVAHRVAGRVAAQGEHVADPGVGVLADDVAQVGHRVVDRGEVGDRGEGGVGGDRLGRLDRARPGGTARAVGHGDEVGRHGLDPAQRVPQVPLALRGLGGVELERVRRLAGREHVTDGARVVRSDGCGAEGHTGRLARGGRSPNRAPDICPICRTCCPPLGQQVNPANRRTTSPAAASRTRPPPHPGRRPR